MKKGDNISARVIISGGGTGGHVYPAIAIARELKKAYPALEILFVGANGRMEMEKVPEAGFSIEGIPVMGFHRSFSIRNLQFFTKLFKSMVKAGKIVRSFRPDVVVGVGGYASGPVGLAALRSNVPLVLQEQNSHAGITNRFLARKARKVCVAYGGMEKYFPSDKIVLTGNPVRKDLQNADKKKGDAYSYFGLNGNKKVLLVLGGSGGAGIINKIMRQNLGRLGCAGIDILWQCGMNYYEDAFSDLQDSGASNIYLFDFIERMDLAYAAADLVVSRAGALTVSELQNAGKPSILVPSSNVAADHQKKNAMSMVRQNAALMVSDSEAEQKMVPQLLSLIKDDDKLEMLKNNAKAMSVSDSAEKITEIILSYIKR